MQRPSVQVVIVNWNSGPQLRECLESFAAIAADEVWLARVSVVDNASADGSCEGLPATLPLTVIRNSENRGFGAACNQGAAGSNADFILFLNPDTRLAAGNLEAPARYLASPHHTTVGIVGIQLADETGAVTRNTARAPTPLSMIGASLGLDRLGLPMFPRHFVSEWAHDDTRVVDQVMGAFFFMRREVFEALGGFDERFFVYYEDLDLAERARNNGWTSVYLASARAFHRGHGTTSRATERRTFYYVRSKLHYARKHFGMAGSFAVFATTLVLEPIARMVFSPRSAGETLRAFARVWKDIPAILRAPRS
jgi:N-acetylglucosaminyl-diphospho-decaprenol L-rhamnosyltransferase